MWEKDLDDKLVKIMKDSIQKQPREYLFVKQDGTKLRYFAMFTNRILKKYLGNKNVSLNAIKHPATKQNLLDHEKSTRKQYQYAKERHGSFI